MSHTKQFHITLTAALLVWMFAGSCSSQQRGQDEHSGHGIWFVHATDPHLYLYLKEPNDPKKKATWEEQQKQDEATFKAFLQNVSTPSQISGSPAFLLITGDFGVDPCLMLKAATPAITPANAKDCLSNVDDKEKAARVDAIAGLLAASPIPDIYFLAGNNDLPFESADDAALGFFNEFFQKVQDTITAKSANVHLHNLTGCYGPNGGAISECSHDIAGTSYRIIGFPSQSFKNRETKTSYSENRSQQTAQFNTFRGLFDAAVRDGKKVVIATHIPEMDDPFFLAQRRYAKVEPLESENQDKDKDNPRSMDSTWNIEKSVLDGWTKVLGSDSVVAVLAGHLHDGHKEIYRQPYSWSTLKEHQFGYRKLFLAPPLSVKNQDSSPIQARGFSVVSLKDDHVSNRFYWFDGLTKTFNPDLQPEISPRHQTHWAFAPRLHWLWELDQSDGSLERSAVLLIALLAAFLTVIAVWQIPPSDNPLAKKPDEDKDASKATPESSPFTTKFGKTVIAGLGGLVFTDVAKTLGNHNLSGDANYFYIVWFVVFFFLLLLLWSALRSLAEAVRSRIAVIHYPLARPPLPLRASGTGGGGAGPAGPSGAPKRTAAASRAWTKFFDWLFYWVLRIVHWFFSLRVPALTFFDTFINLIQGKNQTTTRAFSEAVIDQQRIVIHTADAIRDRLARLMEAKVRTTGDQARPHVRVNISVLSADQSSVFYISRSPGSGLIPFPKRSVAWVSVFTGQIRWYTSKYDDRTAVEKIILYDNTRGTIPGEEERVMLASHYQERDQDYQAFVIFPVPWPQRGYGSKYVKGAVQISFQTDDDFSKIWKHDKVLPVDANIPNQKLKMYPLEANKMLEEWCIPDDLRGTLQSSVAVLGELLYGFNEIIYKSYIEPDQRT